MNIIVGPGTLRGSLPAIPSKSHVHRLLICAALGTSPAFMPCPAVSRDILATARCLTALGAGIRRTDDGFFISPIDRTSTGEALLDCEESGSTYRFLVPVVCALGREVRFRLSGKLPERPMDPLWTVLEAHGAVIAGKGTACPRVSGPITPGTYTVAGNVSSQFISGLLFALPLLPGESRIEISGVTQSLGYIQMTLDTLHACSVQIRTVADGYAVPGGQTYRVPDTIVPEGDWSNAAFWLCAAAAGNAALTVTGLNPESSQGDSAVAQILRRFGADVRCKHSAVTVLPGPLRGIRLDATNTPDLVPAVAIAAAAARGATVIEHVERLKLKESNRIDTVCRTLTALGGSASSDGHTITIHGGSGLPGGSADSFGDHRIAMMAASLSVLCKAPVTVTGAEAVKKSYLKFFDDFAALGGRILKGEEAL